jgi:hypothetical protein
MSEAMQHYGVKGMHWGVRRERTTSNSNPSDVTVRTIGKKVVTTGGKRHPISEDARTSATILRQVKSSGVHSVSNKDLQDLNRRLGLERQYRDLSKRQRSRGEKMLSDISETEVRRAATPQVAALVGSALAMTMKLLK